MMNSHLHRRSYSLEKVTSCKPYQKTTLSKSFRIGEDIAIHSINTAWCSKLHESPGSLFLPKEQLPQTNPNDFNIIFFHHPLSWLQQENAKQVRNHLKDNYRMIIYGHEHEEDKFTILNDENSAFTIEAISFDSEDTDGLLIVRVENERICTESFKFNEDGYEKTGTSENKFETQKSLITSGRFQVSADFEAELTNIGAGFSHSEKSEIYLEDLFVYPNLSLQVEDNETLKRINSSELFTGDSRHIIISGEEAIGKTCLAKKYFVDMLRKGHPAILINSLQSRKIKNINGEYLEKTLHEQYKNTDLPLTLSDIDSIIIDDFDRIKGSLTDTENLLKYLKKNFNYIILFVSESFQYGAATFRKPPELETFKLYQQLKLGFKLRFDLVNKWNSLSESCRFNRENLVIKNDQAIKIINSIIGKNYIPPTPFFLLTILQSMETGQNLEISTSSYGYYYEYLITYSLGNANFKKEDLDEIYNYLKELSYYLYDNDLKALTSHEFNEFHLYFCREYGLNIDLSRRMEKLVNAKILSNSSTSIKFKYHYIFYYFLSNYLADNIDEAGINSEISKLIKNMARGKNASILMFLTHHTRDKSLLDGIISRSKELFKEYKPTDLSLGANFIDDIIDELPNVNFEPEKSDSIEHRQGIESRKDKIQDSECSIDGQEDDYTLDTNEKDEVLGLIQQMRLSIRSLELLGQISKNYYGSLKLPQKKKLLIEAIEGPLRALESVFELFRESPSEVINVIESNIKDQTIHELSNQELNKLAREALFNLLLSLAYTIINKIASSIANSNLLNVIEAIKKENPSNAISLIHLAVLLDMGKAGNGDIVKRILKELDQNNVTTLITRTLIVNYFYMFEVHESTIQQLCKICGIKHTNVTRNLRLDSMSNRSMN